MNRLEKKKKMHSKRKKSIRKRIIGTKERPRLCVSRSLNHIYAQIIDDSEGKTIVSASTYEKEIANKADLKGKTEKAVSVGELIGKRAVDKGISKIVFDRNGYLYHGRIKAVSDGARKSGLSF